MEKHKLLAYCGLYCGGCGSYIGNSTEPGCKGCRDEAELISDCPTRPCAEQKGLLHCGQCAEFPCQMMSEFYHDGIKHHFVAMKNIERMMIVGEDAWLAEQEALHTCSCGKRKLWFETDCRHPTS